MARAYQGRSTDAGASVSRRAWRELRRRLSGALSGVHTTERVAALTFDDGPDPQATPLILDLLHEHGARATFFLRGVAATSNRALIERMASEGHLLGNHTWDHPSMPNISRAERIEQLRRCDAALAPYGSRLFRPPYGHQSLASRFDAMLLGYRIVGWSGHAFDFLDTSGQEIAHGLTEKLKPGAILLMHDALFPPITQAYADRSALIDGLGRFLSGAAKDYTFVTVAELLRYGPARQKSWLKPGNIDWLNALNGGDTRQYSRSGTGNGSTAQ